MPAAAAAAAALSRGEQHRQVRGGEHMADAGFTAELLETRQVRAAFKTMPVKTDKEDARGIAQLMRVGWFKPGTASRWRRRRPGRC